LDSSPALNTINTLLRRRPSPKSESAARISAEYAQSNVCGSYGRPWPCTSAVTNALISVNSSARPRIGGVAGRWPPTSKRPVEGPTRCPVYRLLDCHCSAPHCRHPPVRSQPRPQVFTQFRGCSRASALTWPTQAERENPCAPTRHTLRCTENRCAPTQPGALKSTSRCPGTCGETYAYPCQLVGWRSE